MRTTQYFDQNKNERIRSAVLFDLRGFPRDEVILRKLGIFPIREVKPSFNELTHKLVPTPLFFNAERQEYVETFVTEELSEGAKAVMAEIQRERDAQKAAEEAARKAEEERLPDLEDAVAELGSYVDEATTDNGDAVIDLADYVASLEERIAALEGAKE